MGTVLCESCGKPLYDDDGTAPLEMRYDGVARRSQKANPTWIDKIWNFFSSVKVAVYLIIITLCGAALGTIYPQENTFLNIDPETYYRETYGLSGFIYYKLGLSHTYESWWFIGLLVMIGTSLVVCSLDRVLPLYRALSKQQIRKHLNFLERQKVTYSGPIAAPEPARAPDAQEWVERMASHLRKKRYRVYTDGTALLAEKNRFSRWGPYINHIGLIIFLLAVVLRSLPGWHMDKHIGFPEGEIKPIPDTPYYLKNEKFTVEFYKPEEMSEQFRKKNETVPKLFETKAVLYECTANCGEPGKEPVLKEAARHDILVNHPLEYKGLMAYQFDYEMKPVLLSVKAMLKNKLTGKAYGPFLIKMRNPQTVYEAGPYRLQLKDYYPDFDINEQGQPVTKSSEPNAPAFIFLITGPDLPQQGETYMYFPRQIDKQRFRQDDINGATGSRFDITVGSMNDVEVSNYISYLNIRVDRALPFIWTGAAISMLGLILGFYWQHRRIWLRIDGDRLTLGAHTNKNWFGLRREVAAALEKMGMKVDPKSLEKR